VLAIAAAKTLRRPVLASDIDPRSVTVARENAAFNGVGHSGRGDRGDRLPFAALQGRGPSG